MSRAQARAACERGDAAACDSYARICHVGFDGPQDLQAAVWGFHRGCDGGQGSSCRLLAMYYFGAIAVPHDEPRGRALLARGCKLGDAEACRFLKEIGGTRQGADH